MKFQKYLFISWKYIFSFKNFNITHFISAITFSSITICTVSLIIVLSAFNGITKLIIYNFDKNFPDIRITSVHGNFSLSSKDSTLLKIKGIKQIGHVVNAKAVLQNTYSQSPVKFIGLDSNAYQILNYKNRTDNKISWSEINNKQKIQTFYLMSSDAAYALQYSIENAYQGGINAYIQKKILNKNYNIESHFYSCFIMPKGIFNYVKELDNQSILTDIKWLRKVIEVDSHSLSSLIINIEDNYDVSQVKEELTKLLGEDKIIKTQNEQNALTLKILRSEKLFIYYIFSLIIILASFSFGGLLSMIILLKRKHFRILYALGFTVSQIRKIFLTYAFIISFCSIMLGIGISYLIVFLQIKYQFIKLGGNVFKINYYPIILKISDVIQVFFLIMSILFLLSNLFVQRIRSFHKYL